MKPTLKRWVQQTLQLTGTPAAFGVHSTRHATTSKAYDFRYRLEQIMNMVAWSSESIFLNHYKKTIKHFGKIHGCQDRTREFFRGAISCNFLVNRTFARGGNPTIYQQVSRAMPEEIMEPQSSSVSETDEIVAYTPTVQVPEQTTT